MFERDHKAEIDTVMIRERCKSLAFAFLGALAVGNMREKRVRRSQLLAIAAVTHESMPPDTRTIARSDSALLPALLKLELQFLLSRPSHSVHIWSPDVFMQLQLHAHV